MNVSSHILRHIIHNIPSEILKLAFLPTKREKGIPQKSVDAYISETIIGRRVLPDCNLFGGSPTMVVLSSDDLIPTKPLNAMNAYPYSNSGVFKIPPDRREHKNIAHVIEVTYSYSTDEYSSKSSGGKSAQTLAIDMINSRTLNDTPITPVPEVLAGNIVRLHPIQFTGGSWTLSCLLEYDKYFTNLNESSIKPLIDLCIVATKMYIYNKLIIKMDEAYITKGQELGSVKMIIDTYATAQEEYDEALMQFRGATQLDPKIMGEYIDLMFR